MEERCPNCGNEIFKPYRYCNACGWEKKEEKRKKEKPSSKKAPKEEPIKKGKKEAEKLKKPFKLRCKCGAIIKVKSSKRPLKIKCPKCGRNGTLKGTGKDKPTKPKEPSPKKQKPEKDLEKKIDKKTKIKSKEKMRKPADKGRKKSTRSEYEYAASEVDHCPDCGTRLGVTGSCPNCGYRGGPRAYRESKFENKSKKRQKHKPPKDARVRKPVKGICSKCGSKVLRFFDDGSGRCTSCGREFRWDGGPSRLQEEEYLCDRCGEPLEYVEEYKRWYCYECDEYL